MHLNKLVLIYLFKYLEFRLRKFTVIVLISNGEVGMGRIGAGWAKMSKSILVSSRSWG